MNEMDEVAALQASGGVGELRGDAPDGYWCLAPHVPGVVLCEHCRPLLTQSAEDQLAAIRGALVEYGEESMPSHVSTLQAVRWLIDEHREQVKHIEALGSEHQALLIERDEWRKAAEAEADLLDQEQAERRAEPLRRALFAGAHSLKTRCHLCDAGGKQFDTATDRYHFVAPPPEAPSEASQEEAQP